MRGVALPDTQIPDPLCLGAGAGRSDIRGTMIAGEDDSPLPDPLRQQQCPTATPAADIQHPFACFEGQRLDNPAIVEQFARIEPGRMIRLPHRHVPGGHG